MFMQVNKRSGGTSPNQLQHGSKFSGHFTLEKYPAITVQEIGCALGRSGYHCKPRKYRDPILGTSSPYRVALLTEPTRPAIRLYTYLLTYSMEQSPS